jgi:uncharacterized protein Yka (UPF0111/DUF47 family)
MNIGHKGDAAFYDVLEAQAHAAHEAAQVFCRLAGDFEHISDYLKTLETIEHEGDLLTHSVIDRINSEQITPLAKEDLHSLTDRLDTITDTIEAAAGRIEVYRLHTPRPDLAPLTGLLVAITQEMLALIRLLRRGFHQPELLQIIAGIHAMETHTDKAFRRALFDLFGDQTLDYRAFIGWKEIYERIEKAINRCEKIAGFVESLRVKYA